MDEKSIEEQASEIVKDLDSDKLGSIHLFLTSADQRLVSSQRAFIKLSVYFLFIFLITYLVAKGFVGEFQVGGVKLTNIQKLLIGSPIIMGFFLYAASASIATAITINTIIQEIYKKLIPNL